jgi:hypothetical protein
MLVKPFVREAIEGKPAKRVGLNMVRLRFVFLVKPDPVAVTVIKYAPGCTPGDVETFRVAVSPAFTGELAKL